jgi:acetyl esterase/lipase
LPAISRLRWTPIAIMTDASRRIYQPIHPSVRPLLDPEYVAFHDQQLQYVIPDDQKPWDGSARAAAASPSPNEATPTPPLASVHDIDLGAFDVRAFVPTASPPPAAGWPLFLWFHGGGWAVGDAGMNADLCHAVSARAGCVVLSVGYRLAPEHAYPAAVDDATAALEWAAGGAAADALGVRLDATRVALAGTSAGGNLAAVLALKAAARVPPLPVRFQMLVLPVVDNTATLDGIWADRRNAPWLTPARMLWYRRMYLPRGEEDARRWDASPNSAPVELLAQSPRTWIAVAEQDLLAPEGRRFAEELRDAWAQKGVKEEDGAEAVVKVYDGSTHSVLALSGRFHVSSWYTRTVDSRLIFSPRGLGQRSTVG